LFLDANIAYWAGRYEQFNPKAITLPLEGKITSVGATKSGFAITTSNGNIFSYGEALKTEKQFFDQKLSLSRASDFGGRIITAIGGAYNNSFALGN
jgi:hypothetical protein